MKTEDEKRSISVTVKFSDKEHRILERRMSALGTEARAVFIRKMALDGVIMKLDVPEIKEMISLLIGIRESVKRLSDVPGCKDGPYDNDIALIRKNQEQIVRLANTVITELASV